MVKILLSIYTGVNKYLVLNLRTIICNIYAALKPYQALLHNTTTKECSDVHFTYLRERANLNGSTWNMILNIFEYERSKLPAKGSGQKICEHHYPFFEHKHRTNLFQSKQLIHGQPQLP